jgi:hypothetical protein
MKNNTIKKGDKINVTYITPFGKKVNQVLTVISVDPYSNRVFTDNGKSYLKISDSRILFYY